MTSERAVVEGIRQYLNSLPKCCFFKVHGDAYRMGEPDIVGCVDGRMFAIEAKAPGNTSTPMQYARQEQWRAAGAVVVSDATSWKQVKETFEKENLI